jgi:hypothetical protein
MKKIYYNIPNCEEQKQIMSTDETTPLLDKPNLGKPKNFFEKMYNFIMCQTFKIVREK